MSNSILVNIKPLFADKLAEELLADLITFSENFNAEVYVSHMGVSQNGYKWDITINGSVKVIDADGYQSKEDFSVKDSSNNEEYKIKEHQLYEGSFDSENEENEAKELFHKKFISMSSRLGHEIESAISTCVDRLSE